MNATTSKHTERSPERRGGQQMRAYYWKVIRHTLSMAVLTGFLAGTN